MKNNKKPTRVQIIRVGGGQRRRRRGGDDGRNECDVLKSGGEGEEEEEEAGVEGIRGGGRGSHLQERHMLLKSAGRSGQSSRLNLR